MEGLLVPKIESMNNILDVFKNSFKSPEIRKKILFTFAILLVVRIFAHIPVAGVNLVALKNLFNSSQFFSLLNIFSGGTLSNFSIIGLGLNPYINAAIIMQLVTMVFPKLEELSKEGAAGRKKINQYTRLITIPLAILQAIGMYALLKSTGIIGTLSPATFIAFIITMTAGTIFLVWLGELITERGIGNGISLLITAGIVGEIPTFIGQAASTATAETATNTLMFVVFGLLVVVGIVIVNEATRQITVLYAKRVRGNKTYGGQTTHLPLRLNQAGVIPIIFAVSIVLLPSMIAGFLKTSPNKLLADISQNITIWFDPNGASYNIFYFLLVVAFTYFYTAVIFNPKKISEEIQKYGGFIPGIRPGAHTANYLNYILTRITLVGASFLGLIAILPTIAQQITGVQTLVIGGTGLLIVVSVVLETFKAIEAHLVMRNYEGFLK